MIEVFSMERGCGATALYERYVEYKTATEGLQVSQKLRDTFLHVINEAYDRALEETKEAMDSVSSPRASPRRPTEQPSGAAAD